MLKFLRSARLSVILFIVALFLIVLHAVGILRPVEGFIVRIFSPAQQWTFGVGTAFNGWYQSLTGTSESQLEVEELREAVKMLTIENAQLRTLVDEDQELLLQQAFIERTGLQAVTAYVVGKNPEPNLQSIILNKGRADGVTEGSALIVGDGILVGKIDSVNQRSATAILVNDSRSKVAALIQNSNQSQGVVVGEHGLSMKMELIPQNEVVKIGDTVVTSGLEPNVTSGLVVGTVSRVETEPNGFFQNAQVSSLTTLDTVTVVSILINPNL